MFFSITNTILSLSISNPHTRTTISSLALPLSQAHVLNYYWWALFPSFVCTHLSIFLCIFSTYFLCLFLIDLLSFFSFNWLTLFLLLQLTYSLSLLLQLTYTLSSPQIDLLSFFSFNWLTLSLFSFNWLTLFLLFYELLSFFSDIGISLFSSFNSFIHAFSPYSLSFTCATFSITDRYFVFILASFLAHALRMLEH